MNLPQQDDHKWKIEIFRDKLRHSLSARFVLRFHASLILLFTILVGWMVDWLLLRSGLKPMAVRYPLAILGGYGAFIFGTYLWIEYSGIRDYVRIRNAELLIGDDVQGRSATELEKSGPWDWFIDPLGCAMGGEGCFTVFAIFFAVVLLFYFFGGFVFANAASFFAEIVVELLLAAGLLKGLSRYESSGWMMSVLNFTYWSLIYTLTLALLFAWWAHTYYPSAVTVADVISLWRR